MDVIKTVDLIYLNDAVKALKQNNVQYLVSYSAIVGYDNICTYIAYVKLDDSMFYNPAINGYIINARELSAFIKTITLETEFELEYTNACSDYVIRTMNGASELTLHSGAYISGNSAMYNAITAATLPILCEQEKVNEALEEVFALRRTDGAIYYKHHGKFFMTLFSGLLPVVKSDEVFLTIRDFSMASPNVFIAEFCIKKKKFTVNVIIGYRYV